jgi:hypothetical protein
MALAKLLRQPTTMRRVYAGFETISMAETAQKNHIALGTYFV